MILVMLMGLYFLNKVTCTRNIWVTYPLLMKPYTVVLYDLRMCFKEDNPCPKCFKGDNSMEISSSAGLGYLFDSWFSLVLLQFFTLSYNCIVHLLYTFPICLFILQSF